MDIITIFLIAVGLSMDAFAVAVTSGFTMKKVELKNALKMALYFGGFQALMPLIGYLAGQSFKGFISSFDHWIAFIVLSAIGGKMIYEAHKIDEIEKEKDNTNSFVLLGLAIATSIDALAVGISLSLLVNNIIFPALFIGVVTFIFSFAGVYIGKKFGNFFENKIEVAGGVILIGMGIKILIEHLFFK